MAMVALKKYKSVEQIQLLEQIKRKRGDNINRSLLSPNVGDIEKHVFDVTKILVTIAAGRYCHLLSVCFDEL